jgi:hypothetical protein
MKVIIAGGREITNYDLVTCAITRSEFEITEVVSGMARGVDTLAVKYAKDNNLILKEFPADWKKHGKKAGPIRNSEMANYADALIAVWDGKSKGTNNMINQAINRKLKVYIYYT